LRAVRGLSFIGTKKNGFHQAEQLKQKGKAQLGSLMLTALVVLQFDQP
jgi:hypothetical protein